MARKQEGEPSIPAAAKPAYDAIVALTDAFCREHLTEEYQMLCRKLAAALARKPAFSISLFWASSSLCSPGCFPQRRQQTRRPAAHKS